MIFTCPKYETKCKYWKWEDETGEGLCMIPDGVGYCPKIEPENHQDSKNEFGEM